MALSQNQLTQIPSPESSLKRQLTRSATTIWSRRRMLQVGDTHLGAIRDNANPQPWARSPSRILDTTLTRLRIGHTGLNHHLNRIGIILTPNCDWCGEEETIQHAIFQCVRHHSARQDLLSNLRKINVTPTIKNLLGGGPFNEETNSVTLRFFKIFLRKSALLNHI